MIETKKAVDNLDIIYKKFKKNISSTIIGLYDLSASCNVIGKINHPQVINQLKNINKYLNFTKFRWAFIMPNHLI